MKSALDSSVLISALCAGDPDHAACRKVLLTRRPAIFDHAYSETFSALTGGRLGFRVAPSDGAALLRQQVSPKLAATSLSPAELFIAFEEAESRGVRGGAIHDYLHLVAARKAGAKRLYTLNLNDFLSFHRPGDPEILAP